MWSTVFSFAKKAMQASAVGTGRMTSKPNTPLPRPPMTRYGMCEECEEDSEGPPSEPFYCHTCWNEYHTCSSLHTFRCFTFAVLYSERTGKRLGMAGSTDHCAEREVLWKVDDITEPKVVVVSRCRRNRNGKLSFGNSKPCEQCILALQMYNVTRVCYSKKERFEWEDVSSLANTYRSGCDTIVRR